MDSIRKLGRLAGIGASDVSTPSSSGIPQIQLLDFFFPGFSTFSAAVLKYLGIDLNVYIPLVLLFGAATFAWRYFSDYVWGLLEDHMMSIVEIRNDDEIYNAVMAWIATQRFVQSSRRFVVNTNLNSRYYWSQNDDDEDEMSGSEAKLEKEKKALAYTPSFGSHTFWYRGRPLRFNRSQNREQGTFMHVSEREEISISCFGRSAWVLKELLLEARLAYLQKDEHKTLIYRGCCRSGSTDPSWQRTMSRTTRPLSTVILNENVKKGLVDDITDYLDPATRRWYSNRGLSYRRGFLFAGHPGTGKSSLSLALAGHFKMRIYIVSLSSSNATEENIAQLFSELPRRCVVLLEDIDAAGLTHTREASDLLVVDTPSGPSEKATGPVVKPVTPDNGGRLSLSGLLNILDGVASQEGRLLIMTTNHLEKLDKALIRPGRVDMIINFGLADEDMTAAIFRAMFVILDTDLVSSKTGVPQIVPVPVPVPMSVGVGPEDAAKKTEDEKRTDALAKQFSSLIPPHEFSPAEIQGFLLKHKRDPDGALAKAGAWVDEMRKAKKTRELKEAEEKRLAEIEKRNKEASKSKAETKKSDEGKEASNDTTAVVEDKLQSRRKNTKKERLSGSKMMEAEQKDSSASSDCDAGSDTDSGADTMETGISEPEPEESNKEEDSPQ